MADGSEGWNAAVKLADPQVTAKAKRRRFTAEYKLRVLREADALAETGGIGEMLRREGLYTSHLSTWRRERERGELEGARDLARPLMSGRADVTAAADTRRRSLLPLPPPWTRRSRGSSATAAIS